jgi:hypothetical protein
MMQFYDNRSTESERDSKPFAVIQVAAVRTVRSRIFTPARYASHQELGSPLEELRFTLEKQRESS